MNSHSADEPRNIDTHTQKIIEVIAYLAIRIKSMKRLENWKISYQLVGKFYCPTEF